MEVAILPANVQFTGIKASPRLVGIFPGNWSFGVRRVYFSESDDGAAIPEILHQPDGGVDEFNTGPWLDEYRSRHKRFPSRQIDAENCSSSRESFAFKAFTSCSSDLVNPYKIRVFCDWYGRCFRFSPVTTTEQLWDKVVGDFRQLCLLRRQKKWIEADIILNSDLPRSIAGWSEVFDGQPTAKKSRLDSMFQAEQRRIDDAWFTMDLISSRLKEEVVPSICAQVTQQVRATVVEQVRSSILEDLRATVLEEVRGSMTQELRKSISEQIRAAVATEVRATRPQSPAPVRSDLPPRRAATSHNALSDFAEQVRSTVAQQACAAVLEELAREPKPATPPRKINSTTARSSRVSFDDIPGVIDFVLAEEQQHLKNKYKFELSACP